MQAARVLGYQPREMLDMPLRQLCASDEAYEELLARIARGLISMANLIARSACAARTRAMSGSD